MPTSIFNEDNASATAYESETVRAKKQNMHVCSSMYI